MSAYVDCLKNALIAAREAGLSEDSLQAFSEFVSEVAKQDAERLASEMASGVHDIKLSRLRRLAKMDMYVEAATQQALGELGEAAGFLRRLDTDDGVVFARVPLDEITPAQLHEAHARLLDSLDQRAERPGVSPKPLRDASVDALSSALERRFLSLVDESLGRMVEQGGVRRIGWLRDNKAVQRTVQIAWAHSDPSMAPGYEDVVRALMAFRDEVFETARMAGVPRGHIEGWIPHEWDAVAIAANPEEFVEFLTPLLDPDRHLDPEAAARHTVESILKGEMGEWTNKRGENRNRKVLLGRELFFVSPEAEAAALDAWGAGSLIDRITSYARRSARDIAMARVFGPDPGRTIDLYTQTLRDIAAKKNVKLDRSTAFTIDALRDEFHGAQGTPVSVRLHAVMQTLRNFKVVSTLGSAVKYLLVDTNTAAINGSVYGAGGRISGFFRQHLDNLAELAGIAKDRGQLDAWVRSMGFGHMTFATGVMDRIAVGAADTPQNPGIGRMLGGAQRLSSKGANWIYRVQGLHLATSQLEAAQVRSAVKHLSLLAQQGVTWAKLREVDPVLYRRMESAGVTAKVFDRVVNREFVRGSWLDVDAIRTAGAHKELNVMGAFFVREAHHAVARPTALARVALRLGARPGTASGEALLSVTQFQAVNIAVLRNIMARAYTEGGMLGLSATAATMIASAGVMAYLWKILSTGTTYDLDTERGLMEFLGDAIIYSGVGWLATDMIGRMIKHGGRVAPAAADVQRSLASVPAASIIGDTWKLVDFLTRPTLEDLGFVDPQSPRERAAQATRVLQRTIANIPGQNLPGVGFLTMYFTEGLAEQINPWYPIDKARRLRERGMVQLYGR